MKYLANRARGQYISNGHKYKMQNKNHHCTLIRELRTDEKLNAFSVE